MEANETKLEFFERFQQIRMQEIISANDRVRENEWLSMVLAAQFFKEKCALVRTKIVQTFDCANYVEARERNGQKIGALKFGIRSCALSCAADRNLADVNSLD